MSTRNTLGVQPSVHTRPAGQPAAGGWKLAPGSALSLYARQHSVLEIARGRVWLTVSPATPGRSRHGAAAAAVTVADQVLQAGERLAIEPGQHVVLEAWAPSGAAGAADAVAFRWDHAPAAAWAPSFAGPQRAASTPCVPSAANDWECGVVQPLRELVHALGQGGRAVGTAVADMAVAGGRFAAGLARFALHRIAAPLARGAA